MPDPLSYFRSQPRESWSRPANSGGGQLTPAGRRRARSSITASAQFAGKVDQILNCHFVKIVFRGEALDCGAGVAGEIDKVSHAL